MDIPSQDIRVASNGPGKLVLEVGFLRTKSNPLVFFKYDKSMTLCNDDIAALIYLFSGNQ